jgi:hypothetical protein
MVEPDERERDRAAETRERYATTLATAYPTTTS